MTHANDDVPWAKLGQLVGKLRQKYGSDPVEFQGRLSVAWMAGTLLRLSDLGVISDGCIGMPDGIELWNEIDEMRFFLLPPPVISCAIRAFVEEAAIKSDRQEIAAVLSAYYTESGRLAVEKAGLEYLYSTREQNV